MEILVKQNKSGNKGCVVLISVAIDGPAGAGKSTIARAAAARFGFLYVDTGALYRTIALSVLRQKVDPSDEEGVKAALPQTKVELGFVDGEQRVYLNGEDVSEEIRTPEISMNASKVSAIPAVRAFLLGLQQELARTHDVLMDGRDIGTVVLPNATVKVFLTASAAVRAKRRVDQLAEKGMTVDYEQTLREIEERDENDRNRAIAPLKQAPDAVLLDTSEMTLEESIDALCALVKREVHA